MGSKISIKGKTTFFIFIAITIITVLTVWITGLDVKRTIYNNAFYSLSIITFIFFTFVTVGLYVGLSIQDDFGPVKSKLGYVEPSGLSGDLPLVDFAVEGGIEGIILGIFMWIGITILLIILLFFFETILYAGLIIFMGALYWIFYRAIRLVLRYSRITKNNIRKSMWIGLKYSVLYSAWIYGIIWIIEFIKK